MATGLTHELYLAGAWVDLGGHPIAAVPTRVSVGRSGDDTASSQLCTFTLRDPDGRYRPANPTGPYWGQIGRNTLHRCSVDTAESHVQIYKGSVPNTITTPDSAGLSVTGDIDVRVDLDMDSWRAPAYLLGKLSSPANRSYLLYVSSQGLLGLQWTEDGATPIYEWATAQPARETGRLSVRATLDVDNGASGYDVRFYTSADTDLASATWTQLGATVTGTSTTSIWDGTAPVGIGDVDSTTGRFSGRSYSALIMSGIGGTTVASPDFTAAEAGDTAVTDTQSNVWTLGGTSTVVDRDFRWHGEIRDWPHTQDSTGLYQTVDVTSRDLAGRRLSSSTPVDSAYRRGFTSTVSPISGLLAYWPLEDGSEATRVASGMPGGRTGSIVGDPSMATSTDFACSSPLPVLDTGDAFYLPIQGHTISTAYQAWVLVAFPDTPTAGRVFDVRTDGTLGRLTVSVTAGGSLTVTGQNSAGTTIHTGTTWAFGLGGDAVRLTLSWYASGANTVYALSTLAVGSTSGGTTGAVTISGYRHGTPYGISVSPDKAMTSTTVGHVSVQSQISSVFAHADLLHAYAGETAGDRLVRLASEENIPLRVLGGDTVTMGPQRPDTLHELMAECETADGGVLSCDPTRLGMVYRTRQSMTADPAVTLGYDDEELMSWGLVYDDQLTVNRLELSRREGSTHVGEVTYGPLSILDPPDGAGLTPSSETINIESDEGLEDQADWRLSVGTCEDPRLPSLRVELERDAVTAGQATAVRALTPGDRVDITGVPVTQYPGDLTQLTVGRVEEITPFLHTVDLHCKPYEPYRVMRPGTDRVASAVRETDTAATAGGVVFAGDQCRSYPATQQAGDLDVRVHVTLDDWTPAAESCLASRYDNAGGANERAWALDVTTGGALHCYLSVDGTTAYGYTSSATLGFADGTAHWVRAYYTAATGSVDFYTSADGVTWVQMGTTVTGSAVGGLHDADADFQLGARSATSVTSSITGTIHVVQIIDGSELSPVPSRTNVGADMGTSWTVQSGNLYIDAAASYENYKFEDCRVSVRTSGTVTFDNCWFAGNSALTDEHGLLHCTHADVADVTATSCTFSPETPTAYMTGVLGHHFELYDCLVEHCPDGVGVYNTDTGQEAAATGVIVDGCWIGDHAWFATAPGQSDGSHSDCIQMQGGAGTIIRNTVLEAYNDTSVGDSPWGRVGDTEYRALSAIMITPNVGDVTGTLVQGCYLSGGEICVNASAAGNSGNDLGDFIGNFVFDDSWYYTTTDWLYMHASATYSESGTSYVTEYPAGSGGGLLAPSDPTEWTDGYDGSGTGSDAVAASSVDQTVLSSGVTSGATSLPITASDVEGWGHDDGDYTAVLGGETVTVTAVTGTPPSQTLTVTRAVNGVTKAHAAGTPVQLYRPARVGLAGE